MQNDHHAVVIQVVTSWRMPTVGTEKMSRYEADDASRCPSLSCLRIELSELQHSPRAAQGSAFPLHPLLIRYSFRYEPSFLDLLLLLATGAALRCCRNRPDSSRNVEDGFKMPGRHQGMGKLGITLFRKVEVEKMNLRFCQQVALISSSVPRNPTSRKGR